jgi:DNA mismatch repair protein MutS
MSASLLPPAEGASPAMAQWFALKAEYPDALLFFRMGDFYELFFTDAEAAAAALDIALTARGEHAGAPIPMCGVPVHAAEAYLARLIRRGFRVAVAEQMEDPKTRTGKAPIRRDIVRLITPGTLTEDSLLESGRANLLLALAVDGDAIGAAWVDISTGLFATAACHPRELPALLGRLEPAEILAPASLKLGDYEAKRAPEQVASPAGAARKRLAEGFKVASLEAFGTFSDNEAVAAALVLDYVRGTQAGAMPHLSRPEPQGMRGVLAMDAATRTSLEILRTRDGGTELTLRAAVQRTVTAGGGRLLAAWLSAPLTEHGRIVARQDGWSWLLANSGSADALRAALRGVPDMARALSRLSLNRGGPRDLTALRDGLLVSRQVTRLLAGPLPAVLAEALACLAMDASLETMLAAALKDPVPLRLDEGAVIKPGFDGELDAERALRDDSRKTLAGLQLEYAQRYGVASLKIRHHAQLGYVIEAPASAAERLRQHPDLTLRQGMANGARFSTAELADLDRRISEAGERAAQRERAVFAHLVQTALAQADALRACSEALALLDVLLSAAQLARGGRWCRPEIADDQSFLVRAGRHPVVEAALASPGGAHAFVPNDCDLAPDRRLLLLTGPNMAGKSTFLRQNALLTILAQAGLPVPAESMRIGIVDRLFSRVGASDELARGRSTFMVEMTETAAILHQAGPRSLVVVDEIGRGTSTLDGLAIAWAVLEALHSTIGCRTIFATHFHELAGLADRLKRLRPHTMRVKEWRGSVVFLHEVAEGAGRRSWGVHVAELAGVPAPVVRRAAALLAALEKQGGPLGLGGSLDALPLFAASASAEVPALPSDNWTEEVMFALAEIEPDKLSPLDALATLYRLKSLMPVPADHTT